MKLKNVTDKSVSKRLPSGRQVTIQPGETEDFPSRYAEDPRLEPIVVEKKTSELDLNKDGKVDKKDRSLAAKVLGSAKKSKKSKKK